MGILRAKAPRKMGLSGRRSEREARPFSKLLFNLPGEKMLIETLLAFAATAEI
jgi:hypothetical protein